MLTAVAAPAAADFAQCLSALADRARQEGVASKVIESVLGNVSEVDDVLEKDRAQPEFSRTFAGYYPVRVSNQRVAKGRELLQTHEQLLLQIQHATGVPPQYILAFWGLETNFGGYLGDTPVPDALATLACDSRRSEYFSGELMNALRIIERGDVDHRDMLGSWAGAMGQVQFMPSAYLRHAIDADGDGKRDLWRSTQDALASAGKFLKSLGWEPELRWGREVLLPDDFDYTLLSVEKPLTYWSEIGVTNIAGKVLPALSTPATILAPAGHKGPAFITYKNFHVIMGWNRSEYYALTVGRLADRIIGGGKLSRPIPAGPKSLPLTTNKTLQTKLNELGFDAGEADGFLGPATRAAVARFQATVGLVPDGHMSQQTQTAILAADPPPGEGESTSQ